MEANTYYPKVANLLNKISQETGKQPLIASHPKAERGKIEAFVGNIKVVYGETPNAILASALCLLHGSTSVDQAVLLGKKMVFVLCDEVLNSPIEIGTQLMANEFHKPVLIIEDYLKNNMFEIVHYSKIDEQYYNKYITNNIKAGNNINIPYWQYIADKIKNIA
jgi:diacylglycerol kinase